MITPPLILNNINIFIIILKEIFIKYIIITMKFLRRCSFN
nr:MAG TPA: hypothetical protein [Bacteriophage sp.]